MIKIVNTFGQRLKSINRLPKNITSVRGNYLKKLLN